MNDPRQVAVAGTRARPARPTREWIGLAIVAAGALVGLSRFWTCVRGDPMVWNALLGGSVAALALIWLADWGPPGLVVPGAAEQTAELGREILGRSMFIFESAALMILTAMVAATMVAIAPRNGDKR